MKHDFNNIKLPIVVSQAFFLVQAGLIILVRTQQWAKTELADSIGSIFSIASNDLLLAWGVCTLMIFIIRWKKIFMALNLFLAVALFFPVFFQIKMGLPLSLGLIGQVGGIFELKTSVADKSNFRNILILFSLLIGFATVIVLMTRFQDHLRRFKYPVLILSLGLLFSAGFKKMNQTNAEKKHAYTFLLRLFGDSEIDTKLKASKRLSATPSAPIETEEIIPTLSGKKNVILVVLETFDYSVVENSSLFAQVMPHLYQRSKLAHQFPHHFTPWPFSSKSLYSIMCGQYPYPGRAIDLRVRANMNCHGWAGELEKAGFELWAGYSGDLAYDRMGDFLSHQAKFKLEERKTLSRFKLEEWNLGVDDRALILGFKEFLQTRNKKKAFGATFIPIGSHHPYWVPKTSKQSFENPFHASFNYQDQVLEELFQLLDSEDLTQETVIIVTGDHGKREGADLENQMIKEDIYHVPLFVFNAAEFPAGIASHFTGHSDLKGTILRTANVAGKILKNHELSKPKDLMVMYDLEHTSFLLKSKNGKSLLFNFDTDTSYQGLDWVNDHSQPCQKSECSSELTSLKSLIEHAKKNYETQN